MKSKMELAFEITWSGDYILSRARGRGKYDTKVPETIHSSQNTATDMIVKCVANIELWNHGILHTASFNVFEGQLKILLVGR